MVMPCFVRLKGGFCLDAVGQQEVQVRLEELAGGLDVAAERVGAVQRDLEGLVEGLGLQAGRHVGVVVDHVGAEEDAVLVVDQELARVPRPSGRSCP